MAKSTAVIRASLENYTTADCSDQSVKDCRYHYHLKFEESVGWDWLYGQVAKCADKQELELELWKIRPSGMQAFEVEVREVERRATADEDDNQRGLTDFE